VTAAPLHISEDVARKYLALALEKDVLVPMQAAEAYGWLTTVLQGLLDSLEAEKSKPARSQRIDPLLRLFVSDLADRLRKDGMGTAADRIVEWTDHTMRIADDYLAGTNAPKAVA
jgi:hypothetical protein